MTARNSLAARSMRNTKHNPVLLLTGFEPFGRFASNPSWDAALAVSRRLRQSVVAVRLPVDYVKSRDRLLKAIVDIRPAACLCTGLAPHDEFRLEEIARKPREFADIVGKAQLKGTWPWRNTEKVLRALDVPNRRSRDAGQYVCESTYWSLLDHAASQRIRMHLGFLHVPADSPRFPTSKTTAVVLEVVSAYVSTYLSPKRREQVRGDARPFRSRCKAGPGH